MVRSLETRRQRILRALARLDREITATQQRMSEIQVRMGFFAQGKSKAA